MPIIGEGKNIRIEYSIPSEIDMKIPDYFYFAMAGELASIMGPDIFTVIPIYKLDDNDNEVLDENGNYIIEDEYYDLNSSTAGWYEAFKATCHKLDLPWLIDYHDKLEWYDSDVFDGIIEDRIIMFFIKKDTHNTNPYYIYLINKTN